MSMWIWKLNIDGNSLKRKLALKRCGQLWSLQLIFQEVPFCVLWKWHFQKNTVIIRLMSLFGSYILGIFFLSKYKSLMTLMMSFSFANDKYTQDFLFNFMNMNKKWCFELQMYNVQITQSNISVMYHNFHLWTPHQISLTMIKQLHV